MLPSSSRILAEAISIAFTSLQQRQSISLASFLQFPHLYQSRFPILICNKTAAGACVQFQKWPPEVFSKKGVLKNFANFIRKRFVLDSFVNKVAGLIKKGLQHRYFPVKFAKFLRTPILKNIYERLLLQFLSHGSMFIITSQIYQPKIKC